LRLGVFVVVVVGGFGLVLLAATAVGFLVYSDRPGPGFYGFRFSMDAREVAFLMDFLALLVLPITVVGSLVLGIEQILLRVRLPEASVRIAGALTAGLLTGLVAASVGWYIALAGEAAGIALLLGTAASFVLFPQRIGGWHGPPTPSFLVRRSVVVAAGTLIALVPMIAALAAFTGLRGPVVYDLPDSYRGWVFVQYEEPKCDELHLRVADLVVPVDKQGCGCTSDNSPWPGTWRTGERYSSVASSGVTQDLLPAVLANSGGKVVNPNGAIWDIRQGNIQFAGETRSRGYDAFFVGTSDEYRSDLGARSQHDNLCHRK
jgi:hypothetical protein